MLGMIVEPLPGSLAGCLTELVLSRSGVNGKIEEPFAELERLHLVSLEVGKEVGQMAVLDVTDGEPPV